MNNAPLLEDLRLFCLAARRSSFAATASELGTSAAYVTKRIAILERSLGVKLFHRTTRRITITEDGETIYRWGQKILEDVAGMTDAVASVRLEPRGLLRMSSNFRIGRMVIAPAISELARRYPRLDVWLELVDRPVDVIGEGIDLDIRLGDVPEPHLIAHKLASNNRILCATPAYLREHGSPKTFADLSQHSCLVIRERDQAFGVWRLQGPNGLETVKVTGRLSSNDGNAVRAWGLGGHGIMLRSRYDVAQSLNAGELVQILPAYRQPADVWAVSAAPLSRSAKLRVCVEFLQKHLAEGAFAFDADQSI